MAPRALLAALTVLGLMLAGCTAAPPPPADPGAEDEQPQEPRLLAPEEVANATATEDQPQGEFARTLEERFHTHNYTPANTRAFRAPEGQQAENGRAVYTIAVDPKMVDSPYANVSEWAFILFLRSGAPTDNGFFGGVGDFEGEFTLSIVAERETLAA